ncbi:MAG TPA: magnesium transporter CorA family protein [Ilumatobacteraceae bacterium]|nr:magnesium transporter CorA family protein [Ilumatobacteraceae bacterium]
MTIQTRAYRKGELESRDFPLADVSDLLLDEGLVIWIDLCAPEGPVLDEIAAELELHELAVEDALVEHQRPKVDRYETYLFLATHAVALDPASANLVSSEIDAFINPRWLVTVRSDESFPMADVEERLERSSDVAVAGVSFLVYAILDLVVDGYFDTIEAFDTYFDDVADVIFNEQVSDLSRQRHWFEMRRALVKFHRLVVPMREVVGGVMRRDTIPVESIVFPYYQDVYDHLLRVVESTDTLRDLATSIVETSLSLRDFRQNLVMKRVTSWAAIVAVPTLISGLYGMNVPYPGSGKTWGVITSFVLMVAISGGLYWSFRKRDWL